MNAEIGKRIHDRRKELNISAIEIAARTGLSKATIHRYESGEIKKIKLPVIVSIANILRVNPAWLIGKTNIKESDSSNEINVVLDDAIDKLRKGGLTYNGQFVSGTDMKILYSFLESYKEHMDEKYNNRGWQ